MSHYSLVVGSHGCDRSVGENVLLGREELSPKENPWDWLGTGIYFWEGSPQPALAFAEEKKEKGWGDNPIKEPYVLGAYVNLGNCFDLTDIEAVEELPTHYEFLLEDTQGQRVPGPREPEPQGRGAP